MSDSIRPIQPAEYDDFRRVMSRGFGGHPRPEDTEFLRSIIEFDRTLAAYEDGAIVGTSAVITFQMTVPGGAAVPAGGVTMVTVLTTHRRRGILTRMMKGMLEDVRQKNEPIAVLWASESSIYRRFGYGIATIGESWSLNRSHGRFDPPVRDRGRIHAVDVAEVRRAAPDVYAAAARARPGMILRNDQAWDVRLRDPEHSRRGRSAYFAAVHVPESESGDAPDGYVIYRLRQEWRDGFPASSVTDVELVGATPEVEAALWQFCLSIDLTESVDVWNRPPDDPLWWRLADPRRLRRSPRDSLWARIVDVPAALSARRYPVAGRLVLEVRDEFAGLAAGRFLLEGGPDGATCVPTDQAADLELGAAELGSLYLGGGNAVAMAAAGRIREHSPGAVVKTGLKFGWPVAPWCIFDF